METNIDRNLKHFLRPSIVDRLCTQFCDPVLLLEIIKKRSEILSEFVPDLELLGENLVPEGFPMLVIAPLKQADLSLPSKG